MFMTIDLDKAKENPGEVFKKPLDVYNESSLSRKDKIDILKRWAYDMREIAVAEEENMTGPGSDSEVVLEQIIDCLLKLGVTDQEGAPPTKQG